MRGCRPWPVAQLDSTPEIQEDRIVFWDAAGLSRSFVEASAVDWSATQVKTGAHERRIAETGEPVRTLKITGDPEEAHRLAQQSEAARKESYAKSMQIPLQTEGEKQIIEADELAARMKIAQEKCDALSVPVWGGSGWDNAAQIMWIQDSIRRQCESFKAEARAGSIER